MNEFKMELEIAVPAIVRRLLNDASGFQFFKEKLEEASFYVGEINKSFGIVKQDPIRTYWFVFKEDSVIFGIRIQSDVVSNPYKFFLEILLGELGFMVDAAKNYFENFSKAVVNKVVEKSYIG